jgi:hypothetical protein
MQRPGCTTSTLLVHRVFISFWFLMNSEYPVGLGCMYHDNASRFLGRQAVIDAYCPEWQGGCIRNISTAEWDVLPSGRYVMLVCPYHHAGATHRYRTPYTMDSKRLLSIICV